MRNIDTNEAKKLKEQGVPVIDVLPPDHYEQKHIPGSINIPLQDDHFIDKAREQIEYQDKPVVVYCANTSCDASPKAAQALEAAGFADVADYEGGIEAWEAAGLEVTGKS